MKLALGLVLLVTCTSIGYFLSSKFSKKKRFFVAFNSFNKKFINEVSFSQRSVLNIVNIKNNQDDFGVCVSSYLKTQTFSNDLGYLSSDELSLFKSYLENIGVGDKTSQLNYLKSIKDQIENVLKIAVEDEKKYKKLYIKMGFLVGLILLIIIL